MFAESGAGIGGGHVPVGRGDASAFRHCCLASWGGMGRWSSIWFVAGESWSARLRYGRVTEPEWVGGLGDVMGWLTTNDPLPITMNRATR